MRLRAITGLTEYELGMHIKIMHGVHPSGMKTLAEYIECHDSIHEYPVGIDPIPHEHGPWPEQAPDAPFIWE